MQHAEFVHLTAPPVHYTDLSIDPACAGTTTDVPIAANVLKVGCILALVFALEFFTNFY